MCELFSSTDHELTLIASVTLTREAWHPMWEGKPRRSMPRLASVR
jgi:hypothetical protein